jgi:hypothetical protein
MYPIRMTIQKLFMKLMEFDYIVQNILMLGHFFS